jgi:hypothetical protein
MLSKGVASALLETVKKGGVVGDGSTHERVPIHSNIFLLGRFQIVAWHVLHAVIVQLG